jgi:NAD+ synthase
MNVPSLTQHIVQWLSAYADQAGTKGFVVGVSGGIDSAVTAGLCAATGLRVRLLEMPIHQDADQLGRSQEWMNHAALDRARSDDRNLNHHIIECPWL